MTQTHTDQARNSAPTNTQADTNVGRKVGVLPNGARSMMRGYCDDGTIYDRLTAPEMILGLESFIRGAQTARGIVERVSNERCIPVRDLLGKKRDRPTAHARQDCMLEIRERLGWSLPIIGRLFGRDHTTVLHSLRVAEARADHVERYNRYGKNPPAFLVGKK